MISIHAISPVTAEFRVLGDMHASRLLHSTNHFCDTIVSSDCEMFHGRSEALSLRILHAQQQPEIETLARDASTGSKAILDLFRV